MSTPFVQALLIRVIASWYGQSESSDHTRILKILDVAQDLKVNHCYVMCIVIVSSSYYQ